MSTLIAGCVGARHKGPVSDHFDGRRFVGPEGDKGKSFFDIMKWKWNSEERAKWPESLANSAKPKIADTVSPGQAVVTFVNHATVLLQLPGLNVLTDPVYSKRASPFSMFGPKRVREPGLAFEQLPKIDVVVISHNHYDHLDVATLRRLVEKFNPLILLPLGDGSLIEHIPHVKFKEMDWGQTEVVGETKFNYVRARHWSARGLFDRNMSLWGGHVIESPGFTTYFAGDTGHGDFFQEIAKNFPRIDLALLPIGAYEPRWFMKTSHMNPEEAVMAHQVLKAHRSVAIHFGTWQLTDEAIDAPAKGLEEAKKKLSVGADDFVVLDQGESRSFSAQN